MSKFRDFTTKLIRNILSSENIDNYYLVGVNIKSGSEDNIKIPLDSLNIKMGSATLSADTVYQNNDFINAAETHITIGGQEIEGADILDTINTTTGVLNFNSAQTGILKYIIKK
jgi:hypothetical protein